ncbi:hypothetical protein [Paraburkholderia terricola]|uniref:hypothetical protein n=1 Tax=Paraburkholderia terricola TaxID=169427 RepID=UPI00126021B4|nr:hypothetical protein [Paraburkholderia terricola]
MSQLGTILYKSQLHNIVPAANEVVTMAEARTGQAVGPIRQEQISAKDGNKLMQTNGTTTQSLAPISTFDIRQIITDKQCSSFIDGMVASRLNGPTDAAATPATMSSPSIVSVGISR